MTRRRVCRFLLPVAFLIVSAAVLTAQEPSLVPAGTRPPDAAANTIIDNMYVPTTPNAPFTAKSVAVLTQNRQGSTVPFGFMSLVARDSSGRTYFENRRPFAPSGEPLPRTYFIVIDPGEHTRTMCYVATKTCRINAFRHVTDADSETDVEAPRATATESVSLGTRMMESIPVVGTRDTTAIAAGAYGNRQPFFVTKEVWHSPDLNLDVLITRTDPRWVEQTRKMTEISPGEPDATYFAIPGDYQLLDNRPLPRR
jgi:hypothetical protein